MAKGEEKSVADNRRMMFSGGFDATTQDKTWQRWGETMMDPFRLENILCCAIVRGGGGDRRFFTMHPAGVCSCFKPLALKFAQKVLRDVDKNENMKLGGDKGL